MKIILFPQVSTPFRTAEFDILFGSGIDKLGCLLDAAEVCQVVERKGSWYSRGGLKFAQGRRPSIEFLHQNPSIVDEVDKEVRKIMMSKTSPAIEFSVDEVEVEEEEEDLFAGNE